MDLPVEVINAVKDDKQLSLNLPKARKPYVKKLTKRILHAIGNGLRTSTSIANALGIEKAKIQSNLFHMKNRGLVYSSKQEGKVEHKYHLTTDKPVLGQLDLTKPKRKLKAVKRVVKEVSVVKEVEPTAKPSYVRHLENRMEELVATNNAIQAELIHAQAECFDLKAVIKYLERKGN
jgi:DNA-binding transcriptional regulator GbsR (MarR family)